MDGNEVDPHTCIVDTGTGLGHILICPKCQFEYHHVGTPSRVSGGYLGCRDDSGRSGLLIPIHGECGHNWWIGLANHKGNEVLKVFDELDVDVLANTNNVEAYWTSGSLPKKEKESRYGAFKELVGKKVKLNLRQADPEGAWDHDVIGHVVGFEDAGSEIFIVLRNEMSPPEQEIVRVSSVTHIECINY